MQNAFNRKNKKLSRAPAVDRAFAILRLLTQTREPQGVSALSRALGIGKSTVHGILEALLTAGAIEDAGQRQFRLGPFVEELGRSRRGRRNISEICQPYLAELVEQTGQTSMFGVPDGERLRIVIVVEGRRPFRVKAVKGGSIPLLAGGTGRIALAWGAVAMPEVLPRFTEATVVDTTLLHEELSRVRTLGVALDRGEYLRGVYAAASPVLDGDRLVGILFAVGFQDDLGERGLESLGKAVARAARAASAELSEWAVEP
ncbi:MAG TPA: IclR family transcriptional regulator [Desulfomonilaceae bacterium]|nr:IclR family transcriptional regulator [Desulfomonilaceae bacterium]